MENKNIYLIAIVAIVAIVGIIAFSGGSKVIVPANDISTMNENLAGQAVRPARVVQSTIPSARDIIIDGCHNNEVVLTTVEVQAGTPTPNQEIVNVEILWNLITPAPNQYIIKRVDSEGQAVALERFRPDRIPASNNPSYDYQFTDRLSKVQQSKDYSYTVSALFEDCTIAITPSQRVEAAWVDKPSIYTLDNGELLQVGEDYQWSANLLYNANFNENINEVVITYSIPAVQCTLPGGFPVNAPAVSEEIVMNKNELLLSGQNNGGTSYYYLPLFQPLSFSAAAAWFYCPPAVTGTIGLQNTWSSVVKIDVDSGLLLFDGPVDPSVVSSLAYAGR